MTALSSDGVLITLLRWLRSKKFSTGRSKPCRKVSSDGSGLAQALIHDPPVLVLDEPTDGLDPNQKYQVRALIRSMARDKAIVISTHILEEVEAVCTRAVIIADGKLVADGTAEALLRRLPEHDSVVAVVAAVATPQWREQHSLKLPLMAHCSVADAANGLVTLRLRAAGGGSAPLAEVAHRLKAAGVAVEALRSERGRLDDVFRMLTTGGGVDYAA